MRPGPLADNLNWPDPLLFDAEKGSKVSRPVKIRNTNDHPATIQSRLASDTPSSTHSDPIDGTKGSMPGLGR